MEQINITRDDFQKAVAKALERTTNDPKLTDISAISLMTLSMFGVVMCKTVEDVLFDGGSQDE